MEVQDVGMDCPNVGKSNLSSSSAFCFIADGAITRNTRFWKSGNIHRKTKLHRLDYTSNTFVGSIYYQIMEQSTNSAPHAIGPGAFPWQVTGCLKLTRL